MIPRRWIKSQLDAEYLRGHKAGLDTKIAMHKQSLKKWTKGHLVIGFIKGETANEMLQAQDELIHFAAATKDVKAKTIGVDISAKEVFCELATTRNLSELLTDLETSCPSLKEGSASAGRFVRSM